MGMDFTSDSGAQTWLNGSAWTLALNLAEHYGWRPSGTSPPDSWDEATEWTKDYDSNEGQRVSPDDARALAGALGIAAADPKLSHLIAAIEAAMRQAVTAATGFSDSYPPSDEKEVRPILIELAEFCRKGGFRID